jgi:hypothetical protein
MDDLEVRVEKINQFGRCIGTKVLKIAVERQSTVHTARAVVELLAKQLDFDATKVGDEMIGRAFDTLEWRGAPLSK